MSKNTEKPTARRYDEAARAKIVAFIKSGKTNQEAKAKFGCTAHFAAKLRKEAGLPSQGKGRTPVAKKGSKAPAKPTKPAAKKAVKPVEGNGLL